MTSIVHLIPSLGGGGAERQLTMLASEQQRRGMSVHVGIRRGGVHEQALQARGVAIRQLGDHVSLNPLLLAAVIAMLEEIRPDIVQTWLPQMDVIGGIAAAWCAVPWILSERASERAFPALSAVTWIRLYVGRYASAVVANSRAGAAYWSKVHSGSRVSVVTNAIDLPAIRAAMPPSVDGVLDGKHLVLVVGRLDHQKAVEVVLQAVKLIATRCDFRVLMLGDGPMRVRLEATIREAGLNDRVVMRRYQSNWWSFLKVASVLVNVSRYEGQPNVVLEAMAAGCPLVVSDIAEHRELLSNDSAVLVPREDPAALAAAMVDVLANPTSARARAERAASKVNDLTIQRVADGYESVYRQAIAAGAQ